MAAGKTATEPPRHNTASTKAPPQAPPAAARSASALIAAAGLPPDKLSAAIVSSARFFSLPLKPELMAAMRRQALAPAAMPENALDLKAVAQNREALSLAAAAAESKGVELTAQGLEQFAEAIDPDWQKRHNPDERNRRQRHKNPDERKKENVVSKIDHFSALGNTTGDAAGIKEIALESAEKNPLLAILNKLPGKNGQRWIVLPFDFSEGGREYKVSLRILLEAVDTTLNHAGCMALDIAENETGRRWLFVVNGPNRRAAARRGVAAGTTAASKLTVYLQPELSPKARTAFACILSNFMEIPPERISVENRTESFPCELGGTDDWPLAINEAV